MSSSEKKSDKKPEKKSDKKPAADKGKSIQTSEIVEPRPVLEDVLLDPNTKLHKVTVSFYLNDLPRHTDITRCIRGCHNEMQKAASKAKDKLIIGGSGSSGLVSSKSGKWTRVSQSFKKATDTLIKPLKSALNESAKPPSAKPLKTANLDKSSVIADWTSKKSRSLDAGSTALGDPKSGGGTNDEGTSQKYKYGKFHILSKFKRHGSSASGDGSKTVGKDEASSSVLGNEPSKMEKDEGLQKNRQGNLDRVPKYVGKEGSTSFARSQSVSVAGNPRPSVVQRNSLPDMPPRASLGRSNSASTVGSAHAHSPVLRRNRSSPADAPPRRRRRLMIADDDDVVDEAED